MTSSDAQKSEIHATTGDADSAPTGPGDQATTRAIGVGGGSPRSDEPRSAELSTGTRIIRDETDVGGPLIIQSDDPDLNPPRVPIDPFPTDGVPDVDVVK